MSPTKADNIASVYGLKERKRLAAVAQSNTLIGVAVEGRLLLLLSCLFFALLCYYCTPSVLSLSLKTVICNKSYVIFITICPLPLQLQATSAAGCWLLVLRTTYLSSTTTTTNTKTKTPVFCFLLLLLLILILITKFTIHIHIHKV